MHYSDIFVIIHLNVNTSPPKKNRKKNAGRIVNNVEKDRQTMQSIKHNGIISLIY